MPKPPISFLTFLIVVTVFSIVWGRVILFNAKKKYIMNLARFIMRFSRAKQNTIHSAILGSLYITTCLTGSIILCILFKINILKYFAIRVEYIIFIFIGIAAQMSVSTMMMSVVMAFTKKVDWTGQVRDISWIKAISFLPERLGPLVPLFGAFCEELFFRGVLVAIIFSFYPGVGIIPIIAISTILFGIQQILHTATAPQAITMGIGSIVVSGIGCLLFIHTGSFLPALIAHESFIVFYFRQMGFLYTK